jgi:transcriptional regulator with XRE-family HTH domain
MKGAVCMKIGEKIRDLRKAHDLTQEELADKLHMNRAILNRIELGSRPLRDDEILLISNFFNVSADFLLDTDYKINNKIMQDGRKTQLQGLINIARRSSNKNILVATNLLEQLNDNTC